MIRRAAVNKDFFAITDDHLAVENEDAIRPTTCSSTLSIGDEDGHMNSSSYRSPMTLRSNPLSLPPSIHVNVPIAPTATDGNIYKDNVRRRTDPLSHLSTSQSPILTPHHHSLNTSQTETTSSTQSRIKRRKLHPRWVVRLSTLRNTNIAPISDNLTSGKKRSQNDLSTSRRFLAIKPRYAFHNE
jgi:hypothetical protein